MMRSMGRRRRIVSAATAVVLGLALVSAAPAIGVEDPAGTRAAAIVVAAVDPRGDVRTFPGGGLTPAERMSIDIRRVEVATVDRRDTRVTFTLRDVIRSPRFDQMLYVTLTERRDAAGGQWRTNAGFTTKYRTGYAGYYAVDGSEGGNCRVKIFVRPLRDQAGIVIPWACTAEGPVRIEASSFTGTFRSDAPAYSRDRHRIAGRHTITAP